MNIQDNQLVISLNAFLNQQSLRLDDVAYCKLMLSYFHQEDVKALRTIASCITFMRRSYGRTAFTYPSHKVFSVLPVAPYPAKHYPRAVLLVELAMRTNIVRELKKPLPLDAVHAVA